MKQRAIASKPASCVKAYLLGGIAWFSIPFVSSHALLITLVVVAHGATGSSQLFATTMGLAAVALTAAGDPAMHVLSPADVSAGLPAPTAAAALLGKSGATAMLVLLFLAVTSATSAEMIAVSSVLTYDIYKVGHLLSEERFLIPS